MKLAERVAVITGAAQGIGAACARLFAAQGAKVIIGDVNEASGLTLVDEIVRAGGAATFQRADVAVASDCTALIDKAVTQYGRIDIVVNNAGIVHGAEFLDLAEEDFDRVLRINLKGAFLCGQAGARRMAAQPARADGQRGVIINMSSINSVVAIPNQVAYTVSKGGLNQLTKVMALGACAARNSRDGNRPRIDRHRHAEESGVNRRPRARTHHVAHTAATTWVNPMKSRRSRSFLPATMRPT